MRWTRSDGCGVCKWMPQCRRSVNLVVRWTEGYSMDRFTFYLLLLPTLFVSVANAQSQDDNTRKRISVSDLRSNYVMIGPLGEPIGKLLTVEAKCDSRPRKHGGKGSVLVVRKINGKELDTPITISYSITHWANIEHLRHGETYTLRGYQDATFHGVPGAALDEMPLLMQTAVPYELHAYFRVTIQLQPVPPAKYSSADTPSISSTHTMSLPNLPSQTKANEP